MRRDDQQTGEMAAQTHFTSNYFFVPIDPLDESHYESNEPQ